MSKLEKRRLIVYLIVVVIVYGVIRGLPLISSSLTKTYIAQYGDLQVADTTTGYFVRDEKVYFAGNSGKVNKFVSQGELIQSNTKILEIVGTHQGEVSEEYEFIMGNSRKNGVMTTSFSNLEQGIVSYYADGYEDLITPKSMKNLNSTVIEGMTNKKVKNLDRDRVVQGEPVFKIIDNSRWYLLCYIDNKHANRYTKGDIVEAAFDDEVVKVKIYDVLNRGNRTLLILRSNRYYEGADKQRVAPVDVITTDEKGLLVENVSITTVKKQQGVYVKSVSGTIKFIPVSIIDSNDEYSIVEKSFYYDDEGQMVNTINIYDEIIKDPKKLND